MSLTQPVPGLRVIGPDASWEADLAICLRAIQRGRKILICGNGGSASMASHFAAELVVRYKVNRPAIPCISLAADQSVITAAANDLGYASVFARQIEALGHTGDVLIALTTSGKSHNILAAMKTARQKGLDVISPPNYTELDTAARQEVHLKWLHFLAERIEARVAAEPAL